MSDNISVEEYQRIIDGLDDENDMLIILYLLQEEEETSKKEKFIFSHNRHIFRQNIDAEGRRRRSGYIPRCALHDPIVSAFSILYRSNDDGALITVTGFDHSTFCYILSKFAPTYDTMTPYTADGSMREMMIKKGRPRTFDSTLGLALVLLHLRSRGGSHLLQMVFGSTKTPLSLWMRFGRRVLLFNLKSEPNAKVKMPTCPLKIQSYCDAIRHKYKELGRRRVLCAADGLKLTLQQAPEYIMQAQFFNGWKHDHYVTSVFVFAPDGTIVAMAINGPGVLHDSDMAKMGDLYGKLESMFTKYYVRGVVDSAFATKNNEFLIQSAQTLPETADASEHLLHVEATAVRQLSEWGMRALQGSFPRLKDRFDYKERGERGIILNLIPRLNNLRANMVGISQIRNSFMTHLEKSPEIYML